VFSSQHTIGRFKSNLTETGGNVDKSLDLLIEAAIEMRPGHDNITISVIMFLEQLPQYQNQAAIEIDKAVISMAASIQNLQKRPSRKTKR
jgi:serine/threonine protein phosphatase PrpC